MPWNDKLRSVNAKPLLATHLDDRLNLAVESRRTTLNQGHTCSQAHLVDMPSRIEVIEGIKDKCEALEPFCIELRIFDVGMVRFELDVRVESGGALLCDLIKV